jgi:hypothetical protein
MECGEASLQFLPVFGSGVRGIHGIITTVNRSRGEEKDSEARGFEGTSVNYDLSELLARAERPG